MKRLRGALWAKVLAAILLFITILTFFAGAFGLILFEELDMYGLTAEEVHETLQNRALKNDSYQVLASLPDIQSQKKIQKTDENFRYALLKGTYTSIDEKLIQDDSIWISDNLSRKSDLLDHELHYLTVVEDSANGEQMGISVASTILEEAYSYRNGNSYIYRDDNDYDYDTDGSFEMSDSYMEDGSSYDPRTIGSFEVSDAYVDESQQNPILPSETIPESQQNPTLSSETVPESQQNPTPPSETVPESQQDQTPSSETAPESILTDESGNPVEKGPEAEENDSAGYTVISYVHSPMIREKHIRYAGMIEQAEILSDIVVRLRDWMLVILVGTAALGILLFAFLMYAAGHTAASPDQISRAWWNRVPLDIHAILVFLICMAGVILCDGLRYMRHVPVSWILFSVALCGIIGYLSVLWYCISFAINVKTGKWWRNTLVYLLLSGIFHAGKKGGGKLYHGVERLNAGERIKVLWGRIRHRKRKHRLLHWIGGVWQQFSYANQQLKLAVRVRILFIAACLFELFWVFFAIGGFESYFLWLIGWLVEKSALLWLITRAIYEAAVLQDASARIAQGDLNYQVDTSRMLSDTKQHGEHLNQIGQGIRQAVSEQMKSERMKTELITNVSHDIKTPLTSIINYTDLLSGLHLQDETANQYIEVLGRQSTRLKKLIEDLIEASKASTGNIQLTMEQVDTEVILDQTIGEFEEKLQKAGVELLVQNQWKSKAVILADSRCLWRIFENLMNNICKYAQPGTRAYVNLTTDGQNLEITFRNISRAQLNITADELMERFVRGDGSRHEEGNGLGLSIAESLARLMGGKLVLSIDGDLFKATLRFPLIIEEKTEK